MRNLQPNAGDAEQEPKKNRLAPIRAMLEALSASALTELERALSLALTETETAAERRWRKLGFLAGLLEFELPSLLGYPIIERQRYDELRPNSAPLSARLVEEFGSWRAVCRATYGLQPEGHAVYPGQPWANARRRSRRPPNFTLEEVFAAVRRCREELKREPSSSDYAKWSSEKRRVARETGQVVRIPSMRTVYRLIKAPGWTFTQAEFACESGLPNPSLRGHGGGTCASMPIESAETRG